MFARSFTLSSLSKFLKVAHPKLDFEAFDGPVTDEMVTYAVRDTQTTWECLDELIRRYNELGLSTPPEKIYSEASLGKAYLTAMGIQSWRKVQPDFPIPTLASIMSSYYGGRSEVRVRRELRQVMLCDFLSMYPTVCRLMGLWRFVIADGMTWTDTTEQTRAWLETIDANALKSKDAWRNLTTLVRLKCDADIFPVRAAFGNATQSTIAVSYLTTETPVWYTLADCVAAKLLNGKTPDIVEAITFTPGPVQAGLKPVDISGKSDYAVDPVKDDFYKRLIELRQATKTKMKPLPDGVEKEALDTEQNALKIAANATSYGCFVEINVNDKDALCSVEVYSGSEDAYTVRTKLIEEPGPFFHPLLATLITGAARLMLGLAEYQVLSQGLEWSFCDTDSLAIAKPDDMAADVFLDKVQAVVSWFADLNPYDFKADILKIEDENYSLNNPKVFEPLCCWAVSAKRYALFNLDSDNRPIIRKASAHGLGHLTKPYDESHPAISMPKPMVDLSKASVGLSLWQHDLWWQIIVAALDGHPDQVDLSYHPALAGPAMSRYGATSPQLLRWFDPYNENRSYADQVKPFGFLVSLFAKKIDQTEVILDAIPRGRRKAAVPIKPIAPYSRDPAEAAKTAFDRETGKPVSPDELETYLDSLAQYHLQPEAKFLNGNYTQRGTTQRRHIFATGIINIGKEANKLEEQVLGLDDDANPIYGMSPDNKAARIAELSELAKVLGRKVVADALGVSRGRLAAILSGKPQPAGMATAMARLRVVAKVQQESDRARLSELRESVSQIGLRATAKMYGVDASNLRRKLKKAEINTHVASQLF